MHGRGASENTDNRFEQIRVELEPEDGEPPRAVPTKFYRDDTKSILAENNSPDVGFRFSINPYRGCEHGCIYCLSGDTLILMGDGRTRALCDVRVGEEIYGTRREGWYRRYVKTKVLAHWQTRKLAYRVTLRDGTELIASGDHRFLTERGWKFVDAAEKRPALTLNNKLMGTGQLTRAVPESEEYRRGYLCGMVRGDAHLGYHAYHKRRRMDRQHHFRLALADAEALDRSRDYLRVAGVETRDFVFSEAMPRRRAMGGIRTHAVAQVGRVRQIIGWPEAPSAEWRRGFLSGIFDAEGSFSQAVLRIPNTDPAIIAMIVSSLRHFSFTCVVERIAREKPIEVVRLSGGLPAHLRFFQLTQPSISRKLSIAGTALKCGAALQVTEIAPLGEMDLFDISTGTEDFIANGVVSHNCYARPSHEYLSFSAGLDFETRIMVKDRAPELLREKLASRSWQPQVVAFSGNTDCYQPVERKLEITRRCLKVFAEFRNPVSMITKSDLVMRDIDVLRELHAHDAIAVNLSVTTLASDLAGKMEPRAARPHRRLKAVEALAAAGIPVGVLIGPVIPGLNDTEIPAIVAAAAAAGAQWAGWVMLRLAQPLPGLFDRWLETHYPERRAKVWSLIRGVRGGKENDPRFGARMAGQGEYAQQLQALFESAHRKHFGERVAHRLSTHHFRKSEVPDAQLRLF